MTKNLYARLAAAATIFGAALAFSGPASAADLDYDDYRDGRYKDRTYIDKALDEHDRRTGKYRYNTQKHKYDDYDRRDRKWRHKQFGNYDCLHPRQIRRSLTKRGWHDFEILREMPRRIRMKATNYNGRRFRIVVDKCDATIVRRRPVRRYWGWGR